MIAEIIETGKSVEDAIEQACRKLGCDRDECEWEIIDLPKRGFLGLKNIPAKVRVSAVRPDPEPAVREKPQPQQRPERKEPSPERRPASPPEQKKAPAPERTPIPEPVISMDPSTRELGGKADSTRSYLSSVLEAMEIRDFAIDTHWEDGGVYFSIKGNGLGAIIGRRGDTLDALQYLCGLVANRLEGDYLRVTVDCGGYRVKRKSTLEALARKISEQVLRTDIAKTLEPMNPFERRIIHSVVSTIEGVSSTSVGDEPNRRVVITTPTARSPKRGGGGGRGRDRDRGDRFRDDRRGRAGGGGGRGRSDRPRGGGRDRDRDRDRGERRSPEVTPSPPPAKPPMEAENKPLYGKIELDLD